MPRACVGLVEGKTRVGSLGLFILTNPASGDDARLRGDPTDGEGASGRGLGPEQVGRRKERREHAQSGKGKDVSHDSHMTISERERMDWRRGAAVPKDFFLLLLFVFP